VAACGVGAGLLVPLLLVLHLRSALDLGAVDLAWVAFGHAASGGLSVGGALALSLFAGLACVVAQMVRGRRRVDVQAPPESIRTRGPSTYAGPGSLGGTESALRR
jgi:hypothetical protein